MLRSVVHLTRTNLGYDTAQVFVGVVILAGAGVMLNSFLRWLEKRLAPWQHVQAE